MRRPQGGDISGRENFLGINKMKYTKEKTESILEELKKVPIVEYVCALTGVSRATFYRWMKEKDKFSKKVSEAIKIGNGNLNDFCESKLVKKIQEENLQAIIFWLKHHKKIYKQKTYFVINNYKK